ncbi:MAG: type II secretion system F family protein [Betaproteobacteria bacterium]|jgi:type II secretory pathway component PulF|nr:type II secretion system F family protein [Betaproteobacteria bacterium]
MSAANLLKPSPVASATFKPQKASGLNMLAAKLSFSGEHRADTYDRLANLLQRVKLDVALRALYDVASEGGKKPNEGKAVVFAHALAGLENSDLLGDALEPFIPQAEYLLLVSGERAGDLPLMLRNASAVVRARSDMMSAVISETLTPVILLASAIGYVWFYAIKVVPKLALPTMKPDNWEPMAKMLVSTSNLLVAHGWFALPLIVAFAAAVIYSVPRLTGRVRLVLDYVPPYSIYRVVVGSSVILSLSAMLKSRYKLLESLELIRDSANPWLTERIDGMISGIRRGYGPGVALRMAGHNFPDARVIGDIIIFSESSDFDVAMSRVADDLLVNSVNRVVRMAAAIKYFAYFSLFGAMVFITVGTTSITSSLSSAIG